MLVADRSHRAAAAAGIDPAIPTAAARIGPVATCRAAAAREYSDGTGQLVFGKRISGFSGRGARPACQHGKRLPAVRRRARRLSRSEEHTSELQSLRHLVCRLLLEKK